MGGGVCFARLALEAGDCCATPANALFTGVAAAALGEAGSPLASSSAAAVVTARGCALANSAATLPAPRSASRGAGKQHCGPSTSAPLFSRVLTGCHASGGPASGRDTSRSTATGDAPPS